MSTQWIVAYDESCAKCRDISRLVRAASAGRLGVASLARPDVTAWRRAALGEQPPWTPTLLSVRPPDGVPDGAGAGAVRAWTGVAMGWPLLRALGPRRALGVVHALGQHRYAATHPPSQVDSVATRAVILGVGVLAAIGLLRTGRLTLPEAAESRRARRWVIRHRGELPWDYAAFHHYPPAYRSAIYAAMPPSARSELWVAALTQAWTILPEPTPDQDRLFAEALALAGEELVFAETEVATKVDAEVDARLASLGAASQSALPNCRARRLLARLSAVRVAASP